MPYIILHSTENNPKKKHYSTETSLTSQTSPIRWVHGSNRVRDPRRVTHPSKVQSTNPENVSTPLYEPGDGKTSIFYWGVITLGPVLSANLTPANSARRISHILHCINNILSN